MQSNMKVIRNGLIPFKGFKAINFFGAVFVRGKCTMSATDLNHEAIHTAQMREMLYFIFYLAYITEWLWHLVICRDAKEAYQRISFEREAYAHQSEPCYLNNRKHFNQYRLWH